MDTLGKISHQWFMSIIISQMNNHYIYVDQARYATSIATKYLDAATADLSLRAKIEN